MTAAPVVIIGCGAGKRDAAAAAAELYTGSYFRSCLETAAAIAPRASVFILSALYGLLRLDDVVAPYDLRVGDRGAITAAELALQARALELDGRPVVALCGARYADLIAEVWTNVTRPLAGLGIGAQRHVLAELRAGGRVVGDDKCGTPDMFV